MNDYISQLVNDLSQEGIVPSTDINKTDNKELDLDTKIIQELERVNGNKFSDEQEAILRHHGSACILACAGSGKTYVSVNLIAKRIATGEIDPDRLLYTTYSKAGANEMKERLDLLLDKLGIKRKVQVRTLHSFFLNILRVFGVSHDIIKDSMRTKFIREACKDIGYTLRDDDLMLIDNLLSYQVNNMLSDLDTVRSYVNTIADLDATTYGKIRSGYATKKNMARVIDYDDMQSYLYAWLVKLAESDKPEDIETSTRAREYCRSLYDHFFIDEAQDVSKIQYAIIKALVTSKEEPGKLDKTLVFIGDDDQCLIEGTEVIKDTGKCKIEDIKIGDTLLSGTGKSEVSYISVDNISSKDIDEDIIVLKTETGKVLKGTYGHIMFSKFKQQPDRYYTYLAYSPDKGFKIGSSLNTAKYNLELDLFVDRVERAWIIKDCDNYVDSEYWKRYYSDLYMIPKNDFKVKPTNKLGLGLLSHLGLEFKYPHIVPNEYTAGLKMFKGESLNNKGISNSKVSLYNTRDAHLMALGEASYIGEYDLEVGTIDTGLSVIKNKEIEGILSKDSVSVAEVVNGEDFLFMPLGNIHVGMFVATYQGDKLTAEKVVDVNTEHFKGKVYDLSLKDTRNFIANDVLVHNCIYQWRGSDPSIILSIGPTFNIDTFVLSTNYRCANKIVDYASTGIKCNEVRYNKSMAAYNTGGEVKIAVSEKEDLMSMSIIALNHIKYWLANGVDASKIAVLSRNNFHLALLNSMLFRNGICCTITNEMKLTKNSMFKDVEILIDMLDDTWDSDQTATILWKLCRYLKVATAKLISNVQSSVGLTLKQTIGVVLRDVLGISEIEKDNRVKIPVVVAEKLRYVMSYTKDETTNDLISLYKTLGITDNTALRYNALTTLYIDNTSGFINRGADRCRSMKGLINYLGIILAKDGKDKLKEFIRFSKQYENSASIGMGDEITLTTEHSSKGREWDNVIMFGCDNVSQPNLDGIRTMLDSGVSTEDIIGHINEERRLCYVGNTRAKDSLVIVTYKMPSIFMLEALGVITENFNTEVLEAAIDNLTLNAYQEEVDKILKDKESPYYYDFEAYKL